MPCATAAGWRITHDARDQGRELSVVRNFTTGEPAIEIHIRGSQQTLEDFEGMVGESVAVTVEMTTEQNIQFAHAAPATPAQLITMNRFHYAAYKLRATIIFLISEIALAGFKPLGQVFAQFMMVWQR